MSYILDTNGKEVFENRIVKNNSKKKLNTKVLLKIQLISFIQVQWNDRLKQDKLQSDLGLGGEKKQKR
jgi:hypothetical protein